MGYMSLIAPCLACGRIFSSNANYVPSLDNQPVCQGCMEVINAKRAAMDLEPFVIHPEAYEPEEVQG